MTDEKTDEKTERVADRAELFGGMTIQVARDLAGMAWTEQTEADFRRYYSQALSEEPPEGYWLLSSMMLIQAIFLYESILEGGADERLRYGADWLLAKGLDLRGQK